MGQKNYSQDWPGDKNECVLLLYLLEVHKELRLSFHELEHQKAVKNAMQYEVSELMAQLTVPVKFILTIHCNYLLLCEDIWIIQTSRTNNTYLI